MAKNLTMVITQSKRFCSEHLSNIEVYVEMLNSDDKWCVHHKLEISEGKSRAQLMKECLYFDRPADELVFMTVSEHRRLHMLNLRDETKEKLKKNRSKKRGKYKKRTDNKRPVVQLDRFGKKVKKWECEYDAEKYGFHQPAISACCRGKQKYHKGFKWMYADEYEKKIAS